jgi:transposase
LGRIAKPQNRRSLLERFDHRCVQKNMAVDLARIDGDDPLLTELEHSIEKTARGHDPVSLALLRTIPGVGNILALVMLYELEDITRFPRIQEFVSYGRLVKSVRESNGKRHGPSGQKIGNAHLKWAFSEAAVLFLKHNEPAQKYLATLATRHGKGKALSILAHKLGRAVYFMLTERCIQNLSFWSPLGCGCHRAPASSYAGDATVCKKQIAFDQEKFLAT